MTFRWRAGAQLPEFDGARHLRERLPGCAALRSCQTKSKPFANLLRDKTSGHCHLAIAIHATATNIDRKTLFSRSGKNGEILCSSPRCVPPASSAAHARTHSRHRTTQALLNELSAFPDSASVVSPPHTHALAHSLTHSLTHRLTSQRAYAL